MICPDCKGRGWIHTGYTSPNEGWQGKNIDCPTCEGTGQLPNKKPIGYCLACGKPLFQDTQYCKQHKHIEIEIEEVLKRKATETEQSFRRIDL